MCFFSQYGSFVKEQIDRSRTTLPGRTPQGHIGDGKGLTILVRLAKGQQILSWQGIHTSRCTVYWLCAVREVTPSLVTSLCKAIQRLSLPAISIPVLELPSLAWPPHPAPHLYLLPPYLSSVAHQAPGHWSRPRFFSCIIAVKPAR